MADDLGAQERAARDRLGQDEGGRAAIPFRGHRAHRQDDRRERPELGEVLPELVDRVGRRSGSGSRMRPSWSPPAALMISGRNFASSGEREPDQQEQAGHDRQAIGPPRLEQLLADEDPAAAHAAAPSSVSRPTSRRKTSSSVGRARSNASSRTPAATTSGSSPADAARLVA